MNMRSLFPRILLLAGLIVHGSAMAQDSLHIAAVVNDEIISAYDVEIRLSLVVMSSGSKTNNKMRKRLAARVLRTLIDDKIKLQEAKRLSIRVSESDIERALAKIEKQNKLPRGGLDSFLRRSGIEKSALIDQLEAVIAWAKVVNRVLRSNIQIGDDEIDEMIAKIEANKGKPEHRVAEIFLPVDNPKDEPEVRNLANRLVQQLQGGARFQSLARNFSQSASAAVGGDLGWIKQGQLGGETDAALVRLNPGQFTQPIHSLAGYHILQLQDRRADPGLGSSDGKVNLRQLFLPLPRNAPLGEVDSQMKRAGTMSELAKNCRDMESLEKETGSSLSGSLGTVSPSKLPAKLRKLVQNLPINKASRPLRSGEGVIVLMVCQREGGGSSARADRERVRNMLIDQRLSISSRQYLRDLRRGAFVEVRN